MTEVREIVPERRARVVIRYFDASALAKRYAEEPGTASVLAWLAELRPLTDAVHLASCLLALTPGFLAEFVTYDARLAAAAREEGLTVLGA